MRIIFEGPFFSYTSLSIINRNLAHYFSKHAKLSILPTDDILKNKDLREKELLPSIISQDQLQNLPEPDIYIKHKWPPDLDKKPTAKKIIQYLPWEFGALPKSWVKSIRSNISQTWCYSNFVKDCFIKNGINEDSIAVIPPGINKDIFNPDAPPNTDLAKDKRFKFLFVGGTIARKGIDILINAYTSFGFQKDVVLIIKDYPANTIYKNTSFKDKLEKMRSLPGMSDIIYISHDLSFKEMAGLYSACDCLVSPYRAEGFGMPILEALACGCPAIATDFGACLDFCRKGPCSMIKAFISKQKEKNILQMETVIHPFWAEPSREELVRLMSEVRKATESMKKQAVEYSDQICRTYNWNTVAENAFKRLESILD